MQKGGKRIATTIFVRREKGKQKITGNTPPIARNQVYQGTKS
jgi:hypothetical protein